MLERLILDPLSENSANAPLELTGRDAGHSIFLGSHAYPPAPRESAFAGGATVEGPRRARTGKRGNRSIPIEVLVAEETSVAQLPTATNLLTNPSAELTNTGYSGDGAGASVAQTTAERRYGEGSLAITTPASADRGATTSSVVVAGSRVVAGIAWVKMPAGGTFRVGVNERSGADADVATTWSVDITATGDWQKISVSRMFGANTRARLRIHQRDATARTFWADGMLLSDGFDAIEYFDGDTPGCAWTGTRHGSSSTRRGGGVLGAGTPAPVAPGPYAPVFSARAFDTTYQNATGSALHISINAGVVCDSNEDGTIIFEACPDNAFGSNTVALDRVGADNDSGNVQMGFGHSLQGIVPPDYFYRWRTVTTTGVPDAVFNVSFEQRLQLGVDIAPVGSSYTTAATAGWSTARENTSGQTLALTAQVEVACDPNEEGHVYLDVCPDNAFGANSRAVARYGLKTTGLTAAIKGRGGLQALVPPGHFWRYRQSTVTGTPTFTVIGGVESTMPLPGLGLDAGDVYSSSAAPALNTPVLNSTGNALLVSIGGAVDSDPNENGHLYMDVAPNNTFTGGDSWEIPYSATRNNTGQGGLIKQVAQLWAIIPPGYYRRYRNTTSAPWNTPTHTLDGNEYALELPAPAASGAVGSGGKLFAGALNDLEAKLNKLHDRGGTLLRILPDGTQLKFDILEAQRTGGEQDRAFPQGRQVIPFELLARPLARGTEIGFASRAETTLPVIRSVETPVLGTADGKVRLEVTEAQGFDRALVAYALQCRNYDSAATADVFYEAESRTPLNGAAAAAGPGSIGISGAGSNVVRQGTLGSSWAALLSTQASGGGAHLSHVGTYRVWAILHRPATNAGDVDVALEWGVGDLRRFQRNAPVEYAADEREGVRTFADLGIVRIPRVVKGAQRWEGRIVAKSTVATDDLDVDALILQPLDEAAGVVRVRPTLVAPTAYLGRDEFDQSTGTLDGKTAPTGGAWSKSGTGGSEYQLDATYHVVSRTGSLTDGIRFARLGTATPAATAVEVKFALNTLPTATGNVVQGVFARYGSTSAYLAAAIVTEPAPITTPAGLFSYLEVYLSGARIARVPVKRMVGVGNVAVGPGTTITTAPPDAPRAIRLAVDAGGRISVYLRELGEEFGEPVWQGSDASLATGGALATGGFGIFDWNGSANSIVRYYDEFAAWASPADAALFANRLLEFRDDAVMRQDSGGSIWTPLVPDGDLPRVPVSGAEQRSVRMLVWATRNGDEAGETALDDLTARLYYTPQWDNCPEPA